jgi:hypothetical protein
MGILRFNRSITFSSADFWPLDFPNQVERGPWHIAPNK